MTQLVRPKCRTIALICLAALALGAAAKPAKPRKPKLNLRAAPRIAMAPVEVLITAELVGGDELEEFYCPKLQWDWDDGSRSDQEPDCPPFESGMALERRFTATHEYRQSGIFNAKLSLRRGDRVIASASIQVTVRAGVGGAPPESDS